jgi:hypothetical protein
LGADIVCFFPWEGSAYGHRSRIDNLGLDAFDSAQ